MKNNSIFPHEVKYNDLVLNLKEQYQVCVDAINHDDIDMLYVGYLKMMTFEVMANVYFHSSIFQELEMLDEVKGIKAEVDKLEIKYKECYNGTSIDR